MKNELLQPPNISHISTYTHWLATFRPPV